MSKDRLEKIKNNAEIIHNKARSGNAFNSIRIPTTIDVKLKYEDYAYLCKQTEQAEELKRKARIDNDLFEIQVQRNEQYRESLRRVREEVLSLSEGRDVRPFKIYGIVTEALESESE